VLSFSGPWLSLVENDNPSDRREIQMKRTLSFGFMALMVAAVILYAAKPASAQVTCTSYQRTARQSLSLVPQAGRMVGTRNTAEVPP
jgi:hypothetical protein